MSSLETSAKDVFLKQLDEICNETGLSRERAFPRWVCENILGITDSIKIDEAISIGGKENSYGVDIFHIEDNGDYSDQYVCWAQVKFTQDLNHIITKEEISSFTKTTGFLEDCPPEANSTFKSKSEEFTSIGKTDALIKKRMILAITGTLDQQAQNILNDNLWRHQKLSNSSGPPIDFDVFALNDILSFVTTPSTPELQINFDGDIIQRIDYETNKKSITGYVTANNIVQITKKHHETLFLENPRQTLGKGTPTNKAIINTLNDPRLRKKFWKLNNGITAICTSFNEDKFNFNTYQVKNFKIVNGRQTTFTLENFNGSLDGVLIPITIHEADDSSERNMISEATNTQNPIKPVDLITNYEELNNLALQCENEFSDFYFERQTKGFKATNGLIKKRVTSRRVLEKNPTARSYYAYEINPNDAMMVSDKDFFSSTNPIYYNQVFKDRNIRQLIIPHIFMSMIKALYSKWSDVNQHERDKAILSKDIVKYYILRFINLSLSDIDAPKKTNIENKIIEYFRNLDKGDKIPEIFLDIAETSYTNFITCFDLDKQETWPPDLLVKKNDLDNPPNLDKPSPYDVMYKLKKDGKTILPHLLDMRQNIINMYGSDPIRKKLLELIDMPLNQD